MKIFVDTANIADLEAALERGFASGVTTNPSILAKEERTEFTKHVGRIIDLLKGYGRPMPLSVEVFTTDPDEMLSQAEQFVKDFKYPHLAIKVPIGWNELRVVAALRKRDIAVNCTACMSVNQAIMAASAGANYVSIFYGRIRDLGYDAKVVVEETSRAFKAAGIKSEIIVGSIRHIRDVTDAIMCGADIVTVPPQFLKALCSHPKTDEVIGQFVSDFQKWLGGPAGR